MFQTKYRISKRMSGMQNEIWTAYYAEYRPWYCPWWLSCSHNGSWTSIGTGYPAAFRAMLHIKNHKKLRGDDPTAIPCEVVWQE